VQRQRLRASSLAFAVVAFASASVSSPARAQPPVSAAPAPPDKRACVAAFDRGQQAQADRQLRRAQTELIVCAQESCPAVLRADCAGVLTDVRRALPSIVLAADDGHGHELVDVKVTANGEVLAERLDGRAVTFDPGTFELTFETRGAAPVKIQQVIREGEKNRVVRASFVLGAASASSGGSSAESASRGAVGWVVPGALTAAAVGAFVVAGVARASFDTRVDELRASCAPECTAEERADLSSTLVTSNVALGIGIGAVALAVTSWFLLAPARPAASSGAARIGTWVF